MMVIKPKRRHVKAILTAALILLLFASAGMAAVLSQPSSAPNMKFSPDKNKTAEKAKPAEKSDFNKQLFSVSDPTSIWVIVNKQHPLSPLDYAPGDIGSAHGSMVSQKMAAELSTLMADAKTQAFSLRIISGYRSYSYQAGLYNSYVASDGQAEADTYSARPGHSEHQTGLAVDFGGANGCDLEICFKDTPEGKWLNQNAAAYGFIIRYTDANQTITGYQSEPWHLRYVGIELAQEMKKQNAGSLEQFFNVSGGNAYSP